MDKHRNNSTRLNYPLLKKHRTRTTRFPGNLHFTLNTHPTSNPYPSRKIAAVVVPLFQNPETEILFIRRSLFTREHRGEIAFPGGRVDEPDENLTVTAFREFHEEMGVKLDSSMIIGYLDWNITRTGYAILPVVVILPDGFGAQPNPWEISRLIPVSLTFLIWQYNYLYENMTTPFCPLFYVDGETIWGATARITINLLAHCRPG